MLKSYCRTGCRGKKYLYNGAALIALTIGLAAPAYAQVKQAPDKSAKTDVNKIETVVVTAEKRSQDLQSVPASVVALTNKDLVNLGADDFSGYVRTVPSLSFVGRGPGLDKLVIRGISGSAGVGTTAIYIDDIPVTDDFLSPDLKLFDVKRVEVLRGPQGTLYGEGSMGGTIKIITAKPDPSAFATTLQGTVSGTQHGGLNYGLNAMLNIPVIKDKFALRVVGYYRNNDGWIDNIALNRHNVNTEKTYGGRISGKLDVNSHFNITATVLYQNTKTGGERVSEPSLGDLKQFRSVNELLHDRMFQANITANYDFGWASLTSSTSYFDRHEPFNRDLPDIATLLGVPAASAIFSYRSKIFTEEARLTSPDDQRLRWLVGLFYEDRNDGTLNYVTAPPLGEVYRLDAKTTRRQIAVFGDITYDFTDKLTGTVGVRWFKEDQPSHSVSTVIFTGFVPSYLSQKTSDTAVTPRFTLSYKVTPRALVYAIASRGFRSGGVNLNAFPGTPPTFKPDTIWNYEVGTKTSWYDDRLIVDLGVYYIDWQKMQVVDSIVPGVTFTSNAGAAHSTGFEAEIKAIPIDGLTLSANAGYDEAVIDDNVPTQGGVSGDRVPYVPRYTASFSGEYRYPFGNGYDGFGRVDYQLVGNSYNAFSSTPGAVLQHAYGLANLRFGVENGRWSLTAFINNVADERAELYATVDSHGVLNVYNNQPRTIGLTLRMSD